MAYILRPKQHNTPNSLELYQFIAQHPGMTYAGIARLLDLDHHTMPSRLASLESRGLLLYEDNYGGLYPLEEK